MTITSAISQLRTTRLAKGVHDTAWGTKEFAIKDSQGHTIYFGEGR